MNERDELIDDLEWSDLGREHGPHVALTWAVLLAACLVVDGAVVYAVKQLVAWVMR